MSIQWYPGHMTKARREIAESIRSQDVILEVLDARMPAASENPMLGKLRHDKPCIKILSKSDLADPDVTEAWLRYFEHERAETTEARPEGRVVAIALTTQKLGEARKRIPELCFSLAKPQSPRALRAMVVGIPNVGKSTLINTLMERKVVKASNVPAVTTMQHRVMLKSGIALLDNPGIMWPKIEEPVAALRLALAGAIPDTALDLQEVALFGAEALLALYPQRIAARYKIETLPTEPIELLHEIGRRRGRLKAGGKVDLEAASAFLIHDFRSGALGAMSLERPPTE